MWEVKWRFDKSVFQPGDRGRAWIWLKNVDRIPIYASQVRIQFRWQENCWFSLSPNTLLDPGKKQYIGYIDFKFPTNAVGIQHFRVGVKTYEWMSPEWTNWSEIHVEVFPKLKAFVSRLGPRREKERLHPLLETIKSWGFEIYTYEGPGLPKVPYIIRQKLKEVDCIIVIATFQFYDPTHDIWQTSPWLHREFFGGFTEEKPSMIIREKSVYFDGLLSPTIPTIEFSNIKEAVQRVNKLLPELRRSILSQQKRIKISPSKAFLIGVVGGGIVGSIAGAIIGKRRAKKELKYA